MSAFHGICWDAPEPGLTRLPALPGAQGLAFWPTPIDADSCFAEAGFTEFEDSDDAWDDDFERLGALLVETVAAGAGPAQPLPPPPPERSWFGLRRIVRPAPSALEALLAAADDDNRGLVTVTFGDPARAALSTADGHPIWWLHAPPQAGGLADAVRAACAARYPVARRPLPWGTLSPFRPRPRCGPP